MPEDGDLQQTRNPVVVYAQTDYVGQLFELARVRSGIGEAIEALDCWKEGLLQLLMRRSNLTVDELQEQVSYGNHVRAHLRTALDPHYDGPLY